MTIKRAIFADVGCRRCAVMLTPAFLAGQAQGGLDPAAIRKPLADRGRPTRATTPAGATARSSRSTRPRSRISRWRGRRADGGRPGGGRRRWPRWFGGRGGFGGGGPGAGHRRRRRHRRVRGRRRRAASRARSCRWTACSTSPRPTTSGRSTRATAASCGATTGRRAAARTSATAASAIWHNYLFFETPDNYLVSLDAQDRQGTLARRDRRLRPAVLLDDGADRRRQPRARRHGQRPRCAGLPAVVRSGDRQAASGSSTPCR